MLTIGNITLDFPCVLAPMAGVSDLPFRLITRSFGAPLAFTEMIDANSLSRNDKRTHRMLSTTSEDRPLGIQLLGNDGEHIRKALDVLEGYRFDLLDFNAACPTSKVVRKGKGAALLKEPRRIGEFLKIMVDRSQAPVTVKIRMGWDDDSVNAREVALYAEDAGIGALFIHGRTKTQGYSGTVNYRTIREVKESLKIPVIASGDNLTPPLIKKMFDETGCDGVAVARGALGNPWIFREMIRFFRDGVYYETPSMDERIDVMKRHLTMLVDFWGENRGVAAFHKFFVWYTRRLRGIKPIRDKVFRMHGTDDILKTIEELATYRIISISSHPLSVPSCP